MKKWEENVKKVTPYTPGEQPKKEGIIKLNTNENPYPPSPKVEEILKNTDYRMLRLYPDPAISSLVDALANSYGIKKNQVFVGVGSDDVLAMCFMTFFGSGKKILFPDITYSFYEVWAKLFSIPYEKKALNKEFELVAEDYFGENGGIIFPNPNAPTGIELSLEKVEEIIKNNQDVVVIVDEAYVDFGAKSALPLIEKYDNLLIVQTFSKSRSMAGARIGFAMGNEKLISYLNDAKYSFNSYTIDSLNMHLAKVVLEDETYFKENLEKIVETREWTKKELKKLGFDFWDSRANFIFASHKKVGAKEIYLTLKEKGIYVRYFEKERIDNYLRITIGKEGEMQDLLQALKEIVGKRKML
ncbi:MAG TPA: histidinol-phosphate transaminase [Lachnospiraceae bacterium]